MAVSTSSLDQQTTTTTTTTHRLPERSSTEIVHALFGPAVGSCWGDFSCNCNRQHGSLYAASKAVLFYSNLFGFERRFCLMLNDTEEIVPHRTTRIRIYMMDGEEFVFESLGDRMFVVKLLEDLRKALSGTITTASDTAFHNSVEYIQEEPDDLDMSENDQPANILEADELRTEPLSADNVVQIQELIPEKVDEEHDEQEQEQEPPATQMLNDLPPTRLLQLPLRSRNHSAESSLGENPDTSFDSTTMGVPDVTPKRKPVASIDSTDVSSTISENVAEEWSQLKASPEPSFKCTIIQSLQLECTLHQFFESFLADDAPVSIQKYQEEQVGDTEVKASSWKREGDNTMVRTITFKHRLPRSLGIGPSSALTQREQRLRRYGDVGMCLDTYTTVEGVPASDCFLVEDRWLVETGSDGRATLTVQNETRFKKRTMLKRMIEKSTKAEVKQWYEGYEKLILDTLHPAPPPVEPPESEMILRNDERPTPRLENLVMTLPTSLIVAALASFVLMFLIFVILLCAYLHKGTSEIGLLRQEVTELKAALLLLANKAQQDCPTS